MTRIPEWRPLDFDNLESRLTEARDLLQQAVRLIAAHDLEKVSGLADLHLDEEKRRDDHAHRRRYR